MKREERKREAMRAKHYRLGTEDCYVGCYRQFVRFHGLRHPEEMGAAEVEVFLTNLPMNRWGGGGSIEHRTSNIEHRTSDIEHRTSNIEHRTSNIGHRTSNIEHRTSDIEHRISNIEYRISNIEYRSAAEEPRERPAMGTGNALDLG